MKRLLLIFLLLSAISAPASHIVGGEWEMLYDSVTGKYRIRLILYFDQAHGNPLAKDQTFYMRIFRKSDNAIMRSYTMALLQETEVQYSQIACTVGELKTTRLVYGINTPDRLVDLPAADFSHPQGYYLASERCCRNYEIDNVYSIEGSSSQYAGQTFYLEFPPVTKDGEPFINSSPFLFPPLSDYACPRNLYYVDFGGTDADGDSLVYSLVTPLSTHSPAAWPPGLFPIPGPFPNVQYRPPYNQNNIMGGDPDLKISNEGILTVTPTVAGLFVFAVKCEEYRNKVKIGEVRRDFQMLVLASCPKGQPPVIEGKAVGAPDSDYKKNSLQLNYAHTVTDADRCVTVRITDPDSQSIDDQNREDIRIRVVPLGFRGNVKDVLPPVTTAVLQGDASVTFDICFPQCPHKAGEYMIGIIAEDNACPQRKMDTIIVAVTIQPPPDTAPEYGAVAGETPNIDIIQRVEREGDPNPTWIFRGFDIDGDVLSIIPPDPAVMDLEKFGFTYEEVQSEKGPGYTTGKLTWNIQCDQVDFNDGTEFEFDFLLNDIDKCKITPTDTFTFKLAIDLRLGFPPEIFYNEQKLTEKLVLNKQAFDKIVFDVQGKDANLDSPIRLRGYGLDFKLPTYDMKFAEKFSLPDVESKFEWTIPCLDLMLKDTFDLVFTVVDSLNKCTYSMEDSLKVQVVVTAPDNLPPFLTANGAGDEINLEYTIGQEIRFPVAGIDPDVNPSDMLSLTLEEATGTVQPEGYTFAEETNRKTVASEFVWQPGCEIFKNGIYENQYTFLFHVDDDRCLTPKSDEVRVNVKIKDIDARVHEFLPPNIITPNGDGCNDYFAMEGIEENSTCNGGVVVLPNLPRDNCVGQFVNISVLNRWGRETFQSSQRDFRWYAPDEPTGVYFYILTFTDKVYKGHVTVAYDDSQRNR